MIHVRPRRSHRHRARAARRLRWPAAVVTADVGPCLAAGGAGAACGTWDRPPTAPSGSGSAGAGARVARSVGARGGRCACVSCVSAAPRGAAGAARARGAHARPAALMRAACECRGAFALRLARKNDARPHATHATARSAESTRRGPGRPRRAARGLGRGPGLVVTHEATRTPRESDPLQPLPAAPPRGISSVLDHLHGNAHRGASRSRDALSIPHAPTAAAASSRRAGRPGVKSGSDVGTAAMVTHVVCERVRPVG